MTESQVLEGTWEEVQLRAAEFKGRHVKLIVSDEPAPVSQESSVPPLDPKATAAILFLQEKMKRALTDPEEIRKAEAELDELHRNLDANRRAAGERPLFPE